MCCRTRQSISVGPWSAEPEAVLLDPQTERGWRFRRAALPHLNAVYTMARYLTRDTAEAEYAVQESYLRGLRGFDRCSEDALKPWLLGFLRDFCKAELTPCDKTLARAQCEASEKSTSARGAAAFSATHVGPLAMTRHCGGSLQSFLRNFVNPSCCAISSNFPIAMLRMS